MNFKNYFFLNIFFIYYYVFKKNKFGYLIFLL